MATQLKSNSTITQLVIDNLEIKFFCLVYSNNTVVFVILRVYSHNCVYSKISFTFLSSIKKRVNLLK